jgi:hypothetical protein
MSRMSQLKKENEALKRQIEDLLRQVRIYRNFILHLHKIANEISSPSPNKRKRGEVDPRVSKLRAKAADPTVTKAEAAAFAAKADELERML